MLRYLLRSAALLLVLSSVFVFPVSALPLDDQPAQLREVSSALADVEGGTWMSVDVTPDGRNIVFDLLGDIYLLPAEGGQARLVIGGMDWASQPVVSPGGERIAFISDRSGNENVWVAGLDGGQARAVSTEQDNSEFTSPAWSADGGSIFVSRIRPDIGAFEIRRYDGASGDWETVAGPDLDTPRNDRTSRVGVASSPDGRHLYFAARTGFTRSGGEFEPWRIHRLDLTSGREAPVVTLPGGAIRPVLSPDGSRLVYASRSNGRTVLRIRDLQSGADRRLAGRVPSDQQTRWATQGLLPRVSFTPDGRSLVHADASGLYRSRIDGGEHESIPLELRPELELGPSLRQRIAVDSGPVTARLIQAPALSPDGERLAFSALGQIHVMQLDGSEPRRLTPPELPGFHPEWSPDGRKLVFVSWEGRAGGHVWQVSATGGEPERLSNSAAFWTRPVYAPDGEAVIALRSSHVERLAQRMEYGRFRQADLVRLDVSDPSEGQATVIASGSFAGPVQVLTDSDRLQVYGAAGMESMDPDGGNRRTEFRVTGRPYYFQQGEMPVHQLRRSPDGRQALAVHWSQLDLIELPEPAQGEVPTISLVDAGEGVERITRVGADFADWHRDSRGFGWAVGSTWYQRDLDGAPASAAQVATAEYPASVQVERAKPEGTLVLRGATAITMRGREVIDEADIVISDDRIAAIGPAGTVSWPEDAEVLRIDDHFVIPGLVDAHAHWADVRRDVLDLDAYGFKADLSYGITAGLDVSPLTIDMLAYQDLIEAGRMIGPRVFSTGPAVFSFNDLQDRQDAIDVLTRYRDHYRVANIKQYRVGNRRQRQWFAQAARELGLMPTTEGADNFKLSMTQLVDGFAGIEHTLPVTDLGADVVGLLAASDAAYVPTLTIADEAAGIGRLLHRDRPEREARLQRFIPAMILDEMTRWQPTRREDLYDYRSHARDARRVLAAGGLVAAGSHGEFPGIGLHWEIEALVEGGIDEHEALRIATLGSSRAIGRETEFGSLEPGKLADLVVLAGNPLEDITQSRSTRYVIKNGRVYRAATLEVIWPEPSRQP